MPAGGVPMAAGWRAVDHRDHERRGQRHGATGDDCRPPAPERPAAHGNQRAPAAARAGVTSVVASPSEWKAMVGALRGVGCDGDDVGTPATAGAPAARIWPPSSASRTSTADP